MVKTGANAYLSWFVGYRGDMAVAAIETGTTANQAAASLAGDFLKKVGSEDAEDGRLASSHDRMAH